MNKQLEEKIALFLPAMYGGGAERAMIKLAHGMIAQQVAVDVVAAVATGPYVDQVPAGAGFVDLGASRTITSIRPLMRYLRRERPTALLCNLERGCIISLLARRFTGVNTRIVVNAQNQISVDAANSKKLRVKTMPRLVKRFYPWADVLTAVSRGVADDLAQVMRVSREQVKVVYNPVISDDLFEAAARPLDHPWFAAGAPPVVLSVGRLDVQKDYGLLLRAFARVRQEYAARLIVLGEGPHREMLESMGRQLGIADDVLLPGFVDNPYAFMARSAGFVLSSRWEGLPTVLIEALACGTPVISTDCPSGPREILQDGKYGRLIPVGDEQALASELLEMIRSRPAAPPDESWRPYHQDSATSKYLSLLLPATPSGAGT